MACRFRQHRKYEWSNRNMRTAAGAAAQRLTNIPVRSVLMRAGQDILPPIVPAYGMTVATRHQRQPQKIYSHNECKNPHPAKIVNSNQKSPTSGLCYNARKKVWAKSSTEVWVVFCGVRV